MKTRFRVNGREVAAEIEPRLHLADFLRERLNLTATHLGCEHGVCGACTLLCDGVPVRSCLTLAVACEGCAIETLEGLAADPAIVALRRAFTAEHALQCGYCTPGMLVTARDILRRLPDADAARIRLELSGNLCRCTGYQGIVRAIERVLADPPEGIVPPAPAPLPTLDLTGLGRSATSEAVAGPAPTVEVAHDPDGRLTILMGFAQDAGEIWRLVADPLALGACVPGAEDLQLDASQAGGSRLEGILAVRFGLIRARFKGVAQLDYDAPGRRGRATGAGEDALSRTRLTFDAEFAVASAGSGEKAGASLRLTLGYAMAGPLAQFSRPALVRAFVETLCRDIAANLDAQLGGASATRRPGTLSLARLLGLSLWSSLKAWVHGRVRRV